MGGACAPAAGCSSDNRPFVRQRLCLDHLSTPLPTEAGTSEVFSLDFALCVGPSSNPAPDDRNFLSKIVTRASISFSRFRICAREEAESSGFRRTVLCSRC